MSTTTRHCDWPSCNSLPSCTGKSPNSLKRCDACKQAWYCSTECQKLHWPYHIFDCQPGKPIDTAYHLARVICKDVVELPDHYQTRVDYGFEKSIMLLGMEGPLKLYGLWRGILVDHKVHPQEVRKWRRNGQMVEHIKELYERMPMADRGEYYSWFLQHPDLLDSSPFNGDFTEIRAEKSTKDAWKFIGGPSDLTTDEISSKILKLPPIQSTCACFYRCAVSYSYPHPTTDLWLKFGYVAASEAAEEVAITMSYHKLIHSVSFDEFCTAFESSSIPALLRRFGVNPSPWFCDVMAGSPRVYKSVWHLKQYVDELEAAILKPPRKPPSLAVGQVIYDYGFHNCKKDSELGLLSDMYRRLFTKFKDGMSPLDLHAACLRGELLEYVSKFVKLSPNTAKLTRLLKNPFTERNST